MNKRIFFGWSSDTIVITVIFSAIIVAVFVYLFKTISFKDPFEMWGGKLITALIIIGVEIYFATITPLFLLYNENEIRIKMVIGRKKIPCKEILDIQKIEPKDLGHSIRKIGSGGVGGYTGLFHNGILGDYLCPQPKSRILF